MPEATDPATPPPGREPMLVDDREGRSDLPAALSRLWPTVTVRRLLVGDVSVGPRLLVERKTLSDFSASLRDGRLYDQAYRLMLAATRPLLLLEGPDVLAAMRLPPAWLRSALVTLMVTYRIPVLRTVDVEQSAHLLAAAAWRESQWLARRQRRPAPTAGREALNLLCAIPGIGEERAQRLLTAFGSVARLAQSSTDDIARLPGFGPQLAASLHRTLTATPPARERVHPTGSPAPARPAPGQGS